MASSWPWGSYVSRFWQPITNLANIYNSFVNNIAYLERIFETMDEPVEVADAPNATQLPPLTGEVHFDHVNFGYEEGQTVLKDLNLHVRPASASPWWDPRAREIHGGESALPLL